MFWVVDWGELLLHDGLLPIELLEYLDASLMEEAIVLCLSDTGMKSLELTFDFHT